MSEGSTLRELAQRRDANVSTGVAATGRLAFKHATLFGVCLDFMCEQLFPQVRRVAF